MVYIVILIKLLQLVVCLHFSPQLNSPLYAAILCRVILPMCISWSCDEAYTSEWLRAQLIPSRLLKSLPETCIKKWRTSSKREQNDIDNKSQQTRQLGMAGNK